MQNIPELKAVCVSCMIKARLEQFPQDVPEEMKVSYMQAVLQEIAAMKDQHGPTIATRHIYGMQKEMFGYNRSYWKLRERFNQIMMEREAQLRKAICESEDPLKMAVQYCIVGNYIDFIVMENVDEKTLGELLEDAPNYKIDEQNLEALRNEILAAKRIAYLTDNCGEIVIDKLMIELIQKMNPEAEITAVVRGREMLNDATMEDAKQIGLLDIVKVIHNDDDMPGTCLYRISEESKRVMESADFVISKGQGNFETLQGCDMNVYYIFLCKCEMIATMFDVPKFSPMLVRQLQENYVVIASDNQ